MNHRLTFLSLCAAAALAFTTAQAAEFKLTAPALDLSKPLPEKHVFNSFGCTGQNISPALEWSNAPEGTKSFALTMYDPDAPTGSGWWHWTVVNIPATTTALPENAGAKKSKLLPKAALQTRTDFGDASYGGPCPPVGHGTHHYHFTIYALKTDKLALDANASGALAGYNIQQNALGKASFTATYER